MSHIRSLKITTAEIVVSSYLTGERYAESHIWGILPRYRTTQLLSIFPCAKRIIVRPRFGRNGEACISPEDWRAMLNAAPVISDRVYPLTLTSEVEQWARQKVLAICDCPAVTTPDVDPDFRPQYDVLIRATAP